MRAEFSRDVGNGRGFGIGIEQSPQYRFFYIRFLRSHYEWRWQRG